MADFDEKELLKLSPEERIKRLKEIQKKQEEEIRQAKKMLDKSQEELLKAKDLELVDELLGQNAQQQVQSLEQELKDVKPLPPEHEQIPYQQTQYVVDMYATLKHAMDSGVPVNPMEKQTFEDMYLAFNRVSQMSPTQGSLTDQERRDIAVASKQMIKELLGSYYSEMKYAP